MSKLDLLLEAERRGMLPPEKAQMLAEARKRGLVSGEDQLAEQYSPKTDAEAMKDAAGGDLGKSARGLAAGASLPLEKYAYAASRNPILSKVSPIAGLSSLIGKLISAKSEGSSLKDAVTTSPLGSSPFKDLGQQKDDFNRDAQQYEWRTGKMKEEAPISALVGSIPQTVAGYELGMGAMDKVPGLGAGGSSIVNLLKTMVKGSAANTAVSQAMNPDADRLGTDILFGAGGELASKGMGAAGELVANKSEDVATRLMNSFLKPSVKDLQQGKNLGAEILERTKWPHTMKGYGKIAEEGLETNEGLLQEALKGASGPIDNEIVAKEIEALRGVYDPVPGAMQPLGAIDDLTKVTSAADAVRQAPETSAEAANQVKRAIYKDLGANPFYKTDASMATSAALKKGQARGIKKAIEEVVPQAEGLNQELSVYGRLADSVEKNTSSKQKSAILGLVASLMGAGGFAGGGAAGGSAGILAPMLLGTAVGKSSIAQILDKLVAGGARNLTPAMAQGLRYAPALSSVGRSK